MRRSRFNWQILLTCTELVCFLCVWAVGLVMAFNQTDLPEAETNGSFAASSATGSTPSVLK